MKTKTNLRQLSLALIAGLVLSGPIQARHSDGGLVYVNPAYNNAIYSYRNPEGTERPVANPSMTYVSRAYGQAIYGYPRVAKDRNLALEMEYVSPAWGQSIYSYPGLGLRSPAGAVEVIDETVD